MVSSEKIAWIESALMQDIKANPPIPRLTLTQRTELRALMDAGRVDDVWGELKYYSNLAFGRIMERTLQKSRENSQRAMAMRLQKAQLEVLTKLMADKIPSPAPELQAPYVMADSASNGTAVAWTPVRKEAARVMLNELRGKGIKAFAAKTAATFGVSPTRLRQVLNDKPKKASSHWRI